MKLIKVLKESTRDEFIEKLKIKRKNLGLVKMRKLLGGLDEQAGDGDRLAQALGAPAARRVARAGFGGTWLIRPLLSGEPCPHP